MNKLDLISLLNNLENLKEINTVKQEIQQLIDVINDPHAYNNKINKSFLIGELNQILKTKTIERTLYYIRRLKKSLTEVKTNKINDINLNLWKEYKNILTDSLWIFNKRDSSGAHNAKFWGNFIPQIPQQLILRYTKKNDWVLDPFLGSGTTLIECKKLGRNGLGVELNPNILNLAYKNINSEPNIYNTITEIILGDSSELNFENELKKRNIKNVQLIILHPPYWDILKFSNLTKDLSNTKNIQDFLYLFGKTIDNIYNILEKNRFLALVIGDKYSKGSWTPIGFYTMNEILKRNFLLKSIIVKNFENTKGKLTQEELWRYRALAGNFYVFKHEYIFLFQKRK